LWVGLRTYVAFWEIFRVRLFGLVGRLLGGVFGGFIIVVAVGAVGRGHVDGG
jgi:hypothetical protein